MYSCIYSFSVDFSVDVNSAGEGQLEIMVNNGTLPNKVTTQRAGVYKVSFIPTEPGTHSVEIRFNGEQLLGKTRYNGGR